LNNNWKGHTFEIPKLGGKTESQVKSRKKYT